MAKAKIGTGTVSRAKTALKKPAATIAKTVGKVHDVADAVLHATESAQALLPKAKAASTLGAPKKSTAKKTTAKAPAKKASAKKSTPASAAKSALAKATTVKKSSKAKSSAKKTAAKKKSAKKA